MIIKAQFCVEQEGIPDFRTRSGKKRARIFNSGSEMAQPYFWPCELVSVGVAAGAVVVASFFAAAAFSL